jgi:hypothetical protein
MIWVSDQSLFIARQHLRVLNMTSFDFFSWSEDEIVQFATSFDDAEKDAFLHDVVSATTPRRLSPGTIVDFDLALEIKMYYFGCLAKWMFGMSMQEAIRDVDFHIRNVEDWHSLRRGCLVLVAPQLSITSWQCIKAMMQRKWVTFELQASLSWNVSLTCLAWNLSEQCTPVVG